MAETDRNRQLSIEQENAIALLIQGKSDREVGELVGVSRQTVCDWRNNNSLFVAEINRQRQELWGCHTDRLRNLVGKAVDVLATGLASQDERLAQSAAVHILRCTGLYGSNLGLCGPTNPEDVAAGWDDAELRRQQADFGRELDRLTLL